MGENEKPKTEEKPITEENVKAMEEARNLILEKYNIWELVHNIIKNN